MRFYAYYGYLANRKGLGPSIRIEQVLTDRSIVMQFLAEARSAPHGVYNPPIRAVALAHRRVDHCCSSSTRKPPRMDALTSALHASHSDALLYTMWCSIQYCTMCLVVLLLQSTYTIQPPRVEYGDRSVERARLHRGPHRSSSIDGVAPFKLPLPARFRCVMLGIVDTK